MFLNPLPCPALLFYINIALVQGDNISDGLRAEGFSPGSLGPRHGDMYRAGQVVRIWLLGKRPTLANLLAAEERLASIYRFHYFQRRDLFWRAQQAIASPGTGQRLYDARIRQRLQVFGQVGFRQTETFGQRFR